MAEKMTGGRFIAQTFKAYGLTHVFFQDAILRRALVEMEELGIKRILGHSEAAAAYMADGYSRVSGGPAVCMAQSVGAANLAAALQDAYLGQSGVIAITGRQPPQLQYRNAYQELPHGPMYQSVTKFQAKIEIPEQLPRLLRQAFREATSGTPGPVHLDIAGLTGDVIAVAEHEWTVAVDEVHCKFPAFRPAPDSESLKRAVAAIANAQRPAIVADRGAIISGAEAAIARLAARIEAPVVATLDAKTVMREHEPLNAGVVGTYARSCANHVVHEADLVIFVGSATSDQATVNWSVPRDGTQIIQIDISPSEIGRNYSGVIGINADPRTAVDALAAVCQSQVHTQWLARSQALVAEWRQEADRARASEQVPIRPERLCKELSEVLPSNAILVSDTGFSAQWTGTMAYLEHSTQRYLRAAGSLGWSFPASLGAKCAAPDEPVVCFVGDGGFFYHLSELETARRWGLNTITIVNNNHCLSQGLQNINVAYRNRDETHKHDLFVFRETDFAKLAQTFDCCGVTVERPQDFPKAFAAAMASGLPAVIDVKTEFAAQASFPWIPKQQQ